MGRRGDSCGFREFSGVTVKSEHFTRSTIAAQDDDEPLICQRGIPRPVVYVAGHVLGILESVSSGPVALSTFVRQRARTSMTSSDWE